MPGSHLRLWQGGLERSQRHAIQYAPMILRLTDTLARKLKVRPDTLHPLNANAFADWSLHLVRANRQQFVLAANTRSLYAAIAPLDGVVAPNVLEARVFAHLRSYMESDGLVFFYRRLVDNENEETIFSRPLNPQSIAALRDLGELVEYYLVDEAMEPDEVAQKINGTAMSVLRHKSPRDTFQTMGF